MNKLTIIDAFNAQKAERLKSLKKCKVDQALATISQMVSDMQSAGIDICVDVFSFPGEQCFKMFQGGGTHPISGYFKIGHERFLFGIKNIEQN